MDEFGITKKLVALTIMCMEGTQYQIRIYKMVIVSFTIDTGLKQGDAFSSLLFNIALEKAVRGMLVELTKV